MTSTFKKIKKLLFTDFVRNKDKEAFFENFSLMLTTGIDIVVALKLLHAETKSKGMKKLIAQMQMDIESGLGISEAIKKADMLPAHLQAVVEIGEKSGNLSQNLDIVIKQIEKQREFKSKIRSASVYPVFILLIMVAVGLVIAVFVLPRLSGVYKSLDVDLPILTKLLIVIGDWLQIYGAIALPVFVITMMTILYFIFIFPRTKIVGQKIILNTPVIKRLITEVEVSRFGFLLGTLMKAGYPIVDALNLLENSTSYFRYQDFYYFLQYTISSGLSFQESIERYKDANKVLPVYARQLITSSEKTGKLSDSLENIGVVFEKRNEATLKDVTVLIEPLMLVIIWVGVAAVAFAVILPVYSLVGNISESQSPNRAEESQ